MKKKLLLVICLLVVASLTGCTSETKKEDKTTTTTTEAAKAAGVDDFDEDDEIPDGDDMNLPTVNFTGYKKVSEDDRDNFHISNVKLTRGRNITVITGKVVSPVDYKSIGIRVDFIKNGEVFTSVGNKVDSIKANEATEFEIKTYNKNVTDKYNIFVEYIK